jgi:hypothetical protein
MIPLAAGKASEARIAMMVMTTSNSSKVKADWRFEDG